MSSPTQPQPQPQPQARTRKFPPPCWTEDESQALISAYKDRWSALGRSNLKASDWDSVATTLATQCPLVSPQKTAIQCRHKMEKLRRRYRSEKQRASTYPGRFLSSWPLFEPMGDLDCDSVSGFGSDPDRETRKGVEFESGFRVKGEGNPRFLADFDQYDSDPDEETGKGVEFRGGFRARDGVRGKGVVNSSYLASLDGYVSHGSDGARGFPVKSLGDRNLGPSDFRNKIYGKSNGKFIPKHNLKRDFSNGVGTKSAFYHKFRAGLDSNGVDFEDVGGSSSLLRAGKEVDPIEQMASSVEYLAEVFVKMEKRKMQMASEFVKKRMEMEKKQNHLIMESQKQMVEDCVNSFLEIKKKKKKKMKVESLDS